MSDHDTPQGPGDDGMNDEGIEDLQRMLREFLSGNGMPPGGMPPGFDPQTFARAAGLPGDPAALQHLFGTLRHAMQNPNEGIDWSITRRTALDVARTERVTEAGEPTEAPTPIDAAAIDSAFSVAGLWLDEVTEIGASPDAPRALTRIDWVQQTVDTWISLAEPVAQSIADSLSSAIRQQLPEQFDGALDAFTGMLRSVGGALFATQLGQIIGKLSHEVAAGGDVGIPLFTGPGREGGVLLSTGVAAFAEGLDQDTPTVTLYLAVRELAHARLFRQSKWLRLHLISAIGDYARDMHIDAEQMEEQLRDIDPQDTEQLQRLVTSGALIPPKSETQVAAHERLEIMLALIEGWVDAVTEAAVSRMPGAQAISEMVRRRRATGGPAEHAFSTLVGLELRPRRMREAAAAWRKLAEIGGISARDGLWAHPDLLPTGEELDDPTQLIARLGLGEAAGIPRDEFDVELDRLLSGDLPPHRSDEDTPDEGEASGETDAPRE